MPNLMDYLAWRGDLPFTQAPFNEADGLIFAELSYIYWETGLQKDETVTMRELWQRMEGTPFAHGICEKDDVKLLPVLMVCPRYGDIQIGRYVVELDEESEKQFSAVTFFLPTGENVISYRGTDGTLVGWKEDCNMAFSEPVPSQVRAVEYLSEAARDLTGNILLCGHSKGGNLAMYAAAVAQEALRGRISGVYSYDGPGLSEAVFESEGFDAIQPILHPFVPESSIVGMLLAHPGHFTVVKSSSVSIMQHDPYSWQVMGGGFLQADGRKKDSIQIEETVKRWLSEIDESQRRVFIDTLFDFLGAGDLKYLGLETLTSFLRSPRTYLSVLHSLDSDTQKQLGNVLHALADAAFGRKKETPEKLTEA